jgi:hypothetical protein
MTGNTNHLSLNLLKKSLMGSDSGARWEGTESGDFGRL